ncbi:mechanosensitive ion channel family protein [Azospirillum sp. SYSU D00513]|uniref:mechanosensitive ion channel family protein n=1 Tax=Azospirillum sp. SYSU D00513 TaxID=2812561 RepID=UPI001A973C24|nr:mechanosensitive ion channel family protein [Azospirillum sp. SYSU D00513]
MQIDLSIALDRITSIVRGGIALLPNLVLALVVFVVFLLVARVARAAITRLVGHHGSLALQQVLGRLTQGGILVVGGFVALTILVPTLTAGSLIQLLGISGVAIGFAFKDILQNFLAGILILLSRPFRIGDQIVFGSYEGTVEDIQTRATILRTYDDRRAVIPNAKLFTDSVLVNTAYPHRVSEYDLTLPAGIEAEPAREAILRAVRGVPGVASDPPPAILVTRGDPQAVGLKVQWWGPSRRADMLRVQDRVMEAIETAMRDGGTAKTGG